MTMIKHHHHDEESIAQPCSQFAQANEQTTEIVSANYRTQILNAQVHGGGGGGGGGGERVCSFHHTKVYHTYARKERKKHTKSNVSQVSRRKQNQ